MREDHIDQPLSQNYYTAGEEREDEPEPLRYEGQDEYSVSQEYQETVQNQAQEDKEYQSRYQEEPIPESDSVAEQDEEEEQRVTSAKDTETAASESSFQLPRSPNAMERKIFGAMLPKHGVYFLPDLKVLDFIRVLNNYKRKSLKEGKLDEAKRAKNKINELRNKEMLRQLTNMCISHEKEISTVEKAQK